MTDITFITSNQTKIAHARYLCRDYDVNILQYKKLFYGVGYYEPRIFDRSKLLKVSFDDAVKRWEKNVSNYGTRLFFIEDTSVKIEALSDDENEAPGVDIKYWMRETSFESLDNELRKRGNNRKVSVSSHIILFLTDELRGTLGIQEKFKVFKSTSYGSIVEKEEFFDSQILYPWLDNKTFNKWFVPNGFSLPISMLSIEDADKGDFRRGAFEEMLSFLRDHKQIRTSAKTIMDPKLQFDDVYIICGQTCAGKSTIGNYLVDKFGYYHIEASDFMTLRYLETHGSKFLIDKNLFAAEMLNVDPTFVVNRVVDFIKDHKIYDKFVVTGFRTKCEVESFLKKIPFLRVRVVYLQADYNRRFERWVNRHRDDDSYTKERFAEIDEIQTKIGVTAIPNLKKVSIFENNGDDLSKYYIEFRKRFGNSIIEEQYSFNVEKVLSVKKLSLEKAILIVLSLEYQKDETACFTTTEISKLINTKFKFIKKNKNNVSRYFNQSYYIYYEIRKVNKTNKYKISLIGYSEALVIMRTISNMLR